MPDWLSRIPQRDGLLAGVILNSGSRLCVLLELMERKLLFAVHAARLRSQRQRLLVFNYPLQLLDVVIQMLKMLMGALGGLSRLWAHSFGSRLLFLQTVLW